MGPPMGFSIPALVDILDIFQVEASKRKDILEKCLYLWSECNKREDSNG